MEDQLSRWARENPEQMEAISRLPASEQNDALRAAYSRLELTRDSRGAEAYPEDAHLEADYEDRQNGGE